MKKVGHIKTCDVLVIALKLDNVNTYILILKGI